MPKVSMVCSVHNAGQYLNAFIRSILLQEFTDFEAIFIDADSTDGTREALREFAKNDRRLKVIETGFISIAEALNIGLRAAAGEYIARVDADNLLFSSFLADQVEFLDDHQDIDFVIADQLKINAGNKVIGMIPFLMSDYAMKKHLLFKTAIGGAPMLGRRKAFFDVGLYEETTIITEDRIFALKARRTKRFASLNKINYVYRVHAQAITHRYKRTAEHLAIVKGYESKYIDLDDYYNELASYQDILDGKFNYKELILKKVANTILYCGLRLAEHGRAVDGIAELEKAMRIYPPNSGFYRFFIRQIERGRHDLEALARKVDHWLPYNIDLLQLVPVKAWKKSLSSRKDKEVYNKTREQYRALLQQVGK